MGHLEVTRGQKLIKRLEETLYLTVNSGAQVLSDHFLQSHKLGISPEFTHSCLG